MMRNLQLSRIDRVALLLSLIAFFASYLVADKVFERMPHIEDEMAYVWQAQVLAQGKVMLPSPLDAKSFLVPFVVDYHGQRFGKYPLGWPLVLSFGVLLHARDWVNPLLAGMGIWLTYLLGKKIFDERVALLSAVLMATSPFFLMNSGSLLSHPWSLFLSLAFVLAWFDSFDSRNKLPAWLTVSVAGLSLGVLAMTRPLTAVGIGFPFFIHGLILLIRGDKSTRIKILTIGLLAAFVAALVPLWQFAVTGDPMLNPYTLWWPYDKIGFGPGVGRQTGGNNLHWVLSSLQVSFTAGAKDFFGWGNFSFALLPFGLIALKRNWRSWLVASVFVSVVLAYTAYWIGADLYGPRYYYESFYSITLVCAAGFFWLAEGINKLRRIRKWTKISAAILGIFLAGYNLVVYLPARFKSMTALYGIQSSMLKPFETQQAQELAPALIIVHPQKTWAEYGGLLELENANLNSPLIFALSYGPVLDGALARDYSDRNIYHYYADQPEKFYLSPR